MNSLGADRRLNRHFDPDRKPGMAWHKFLIRFALWLSALSSMGNAFSYASGIPYGEDAAAVYAAYPGLNVLDKLMAAACVVLAVHAIVTRAALAGLRTSGPKKLIVLFAGNLALNLFYMIMASVVTGMSVTQMFDASAVGTLAVSVFLILFNRSYYAARASLFVN